MNFIPIKNINIENTLDYDLMIPSTIFALSTPLGKSGLCIFRLSGPKAFEVINFIRGIIFFMLLGIQTFVQQTFGRKT